MIEESAVPVLKAFNHPLPISKVMKMMTTMSGPTFNVITPFHNFYPLLIIYYLLLFVKYDIIVHERQVKKDQLQVL